jgi:hypothetical protein
MHSKAITANLRVRRLRKPVRFRAIEFLPIHGLFTHRQPFIIDSIGLYRAFGQITSTSSS